MDASQILSTNKNNGVIDNFIQVWQMHLVENKLSDKQAIEVVENLNQLVYDKFLYFRHDEGGDDCTVNLAVLYDKLHQLYLRHPFHSSVKKCFSSFLDDYEDFYINKYRHDFVKKSQFSPYNNLSADNAIINNFFLNYNYPQHPIVEFYSQFLDYLVALRNGEDVLDDFESFYHGSGMIISEQQDLSWPGLLPENYSRDMVKILHQIYARQLEIFIDKISIEATMYFIEHPHNNFSQKIVSLIDLMTKTQHLTSLANNFKQEHIDILLASKSLPEYKKFIDTTFLLKIDNTQSLEAIAEKGAFFDVLLDNYFIDAGFNGCETVNTLSQYWNLVKQHAPMKNENLINYNLHKDFVEQLIKTNSYYRLHDNLKDKNDVKIKRKI